MSFQLLWRPHLAHRRKLREFRSDVIEIVVPAELLDGHQELHGGDAQLRDEFGRLQQGAQRDEYGADAGERDGDLHPAHAVGHDQADPGALGHARRR